MLILRMLRGSLQEVSAEEAVRRVSAALKSEYRGFIQGTIAAQATFLNLQPHQVVASQPRTAASYSAGPPIVDGEVFTNGSHLVAVSVTAAPRMSAASREKRLQRVSVDYVGPVEESGILDLLAGTVSLGGESRLEPFAYASEEFDELASEGRAPRLEESPQTVAACQILRDKTARTLVLAVKASGGLLVRDMEKQLPGPLKDGSDLAQKRLQEAGLVDSEIVVVCSKSQAQTARVASRELLYELSQKGLKCACGRSVSEERIEEALKITELGRTLTDKSRWLSLLAVEELLMHA